MVRFLSFLSRSKGKDLTEFQKVIANTLTAADASRPITEQQQAYNLGVNEPMISDAGLLKLVENLAVITEKDETKGTESVTIDLNMLAARFRISPVHRCSYVEEIDARIRMLQTEEFIDRAEMEMSEDAYDFGASNLLEAIGDLIITGCSDSINGRKAKLLKVQPRAFEITVPEKTQEKKPSSWM